MVYIMNDIDEDIYINNNCFFSGAKGLLSLTHLPLTDINPKYLIH